MSKEIDSEEVYEDDTPELEQADEKKAQRTAPAQAKHRQQDMEL